MKAILGVSDIGYMACMYKTNGFELARRFRANPRVIFGINNEPCAEVPLPFMCPLTGRRHDMVCIRGSERRG